MRKVTLTFGLLAGVIVSLFMVILIPLCQRGVIDFSNSDLIGYASMVIALSMIFFGIKSYRDNYLNGIITFKKGLQIGLLITLVASLVYAVAGETYYQLDTQGQLALMDKYAEYHINKTKANGASPDEVGQLIKEMDEMKEMHSHLWARFAMTVAIILPVAIVIAVISAALLRNKKFFPA